MKIINRFTQRCEHRHSVKTHPHCFNDKGLPKYLDGDTPKLPKILVFDIETAPLEASVFQKSIYGKFISDDQILSDWFMLTWSAKWLFDDDVMSDRLTGREAINENDKRISTSLWNLLNQADITVAHNGDRFDTPNMNTRFIVNDLPPTIPYRTIDTLKVAKRQFGFTHNGLDALAKALGFDVGKLETRFELWKKCRAGDDESLKYMDEYNQNDVVLLEKVYLKLRPWIRPHVNVGVYMEEGSEVCVACGCKEVTWLSGKFYTTNANKYPLYQCDDCGAFGRGRFGVYDKDKRKRLGAPVAR